MNHCYLIIGRESGNHLTHFTGPPTFIEGPGRFTEGGVEGPLVVEELLAIVGNGGELTIDGQGHTKTRAEGENEFFARSGDAPSSRHGGVVHDADVEAALVTQSLLQGETAPRAIELGVDGRAPPLYS